MSSISEDKGRQQKIVFAVLRECSDKIDLILTISPAVRQPFKEKIVFIPSGEFIWNKIWFW